MDIMSRTVTYLYPKPEKATALKMFQDTTNQVRAFHFTREHIEDVKKLEAGRNYAVYFLFDESTDSEMTEVYVGKSMNGVERIVEHNKTKDFWTYCVMFVTDNNSFDMAAIDHIERYFIQLLKNSSKYSLDNKEMRDKKPVADIFNEARMKIFVDQIDFLLKAEGIDLSQVLLTKSEPTAIPQPDAKIEDGVVYFEPKEPEFNAKVSVQDGKFILHQGSIVRDPLESSKDWKDGGKFYRRNSNIIKELLEDKKITKIADGEYQTTINLSANSPSMIASWVSGGHKNGWDFFVGLNEYRNQDK